jgi:sigma-B regulation protein RsbU (phosphoserine phosphatase)
MAESPIDQPLTLEPLMAMGMTQAMGPVIIQPGRPVTLGRSAEADIVLTDETHTLSRKHAELSRRGDRWVVNDLSSRHGTFLNGVRLQPGDHQEVRSGDSIRFGPWSFIARTHTDDPNQPNATSIVTSMDSGADMRVEQIPERELALRAQAKLDLLLENAAAIASAASERLMAETVLSVLVRGTGFPRAAFVKPSGNDQVELVATLGGEAGTLGFSLSRSLLRAAAEGRVVRLDASAVAAPDYGQSIMSLGIHSALCAPVMIGGALTALIYLDARGQERDVQPDAAAFCSAVARLAGLSLSNLKRVELEQRQKVVSMELHAAREAQKLIMPPLSREFEISPGKCVRYAMHSRPGRLVSGDLFDVLALPSGKIGIFLGDVAGKGAVAAVLMAAAQSHLHALLKQFDEPGVVVTQLNEYLNERVQSGSFITLFAAIIDPPRDGKPGILRYTDAGHGYWLVRDGNTPARKVEVNGGPPVGVLGAYPYQTETVDLVPGSRLIVYSDGVHEQRTTDGEEFGLTRTLSALADSPDARTDVERLLSALTVAAGPQHAMPNTVGDIAFADDVTIASVEIE